MEIKRNAITITGAEQALDILEKLHAKAEEALAKTTHEPTIKGIRNILHNNVEPAEVIIKKAIKRGKITKAEAVALLKHVYIAYHKGGKIDGAISADLSSMCAFCERMAKNPEFICAGCYARAQREQMKVYTQLRHMLNTAILALTAYDKQSLRTVTLGGSDILRICEDGDTPNAEAATNMIELTKLHEAGRPKNNAGYWYKNEPAVSAGIEEAGNPKRTRFIHSSPRMNTPAAPGKNDDAIFTVYDNKAAYEAAIKAGAHECKGTEKDSGGCKGCGWYCYKCKKREPGAEPVQIAEKLRISGKPVF
jgi:hypothetical protein